MRSNKKSKTRSHFFVVLFLISTLSVLVGLYISKSVPKKTAQEIRQEVCGVWVEVGVPKNITQIIEVSIEGVRRNGRLISTKFEYDGKYFTFSTGSGVHKFLIDREDVEEGLAPRLFLSQRSDSYYNPTYRKI